MTYPEMLSLSTSPSRLPKPNVGFQLHRKPLVWLISAHFCLKTESSSVCPTNNQGMIFSSKRRDTSTQLSYWELENTQFGPALPVFSKKFSVFVELGTFLGVLSTLNMQNRSSIKTVFLAEFFNHFLCHYRTQPSVPWQRTVALKALLESLFHDSLWAMLKEESTPKKVPNSTKTQNFLEHTGRAGPNWVFSNSQYDN